jgi:tRNA A37 threonylcarbamoyladenosine dehydratase
VLTTVIAILLYPVFISEESYNKWMPYVIAVSMLASLGFLLYSFLINPDGVDGDTVSETNKNRQLIALSSTEGHEKAETSAKRLRDINPDCEVTSLNLFYSAETKDEIDLTEYDYIADCIDTVTSKLLLITSANELKVPIISSMGTGNRLDPSQITVTDVFKTSGDPLARIMRKELRARNVESLKVVCSLEEPGKCCEGRNEITGRATPSSAVFVPATAGLRMAYEIVKELLYEF